MKKYIACRVRNAIDIVGDFINYYDDFNGFFFYDDHSSDGTKEFLLSHPRVIKVIDDEKEKWSTDSWKMQNLQRQKICDELVAYCDPNDWLFLLDCDEFMIFNKKALDTESVVCLNLYDAVITKHDVDDHFLNRQWFEKFCREIVFGVKAKDFRSVVSHRTIHTKSGRAVGKPVGSVKHFGKARSIEKFNEKCDYYVKHSPLSSYKKKWSSRKGNGLVEINKNIHFNWDESFSNNANDVEVQKD